MYFIYNIDQIHSVFNIFNKCFFFPFKKKKKTRKREYKREYLSNLSSNTVKKKKYNQSGRSACAA